MIVKIIPNRSPDVNREMHPTFIVTNCKQDSYNGTSRTVPLPNGVHAIRTQLRKTERFRVHQSIPVMARIPQGLKSKTCSSWVSHSGIVRGKRRKRRAGTHRTL